MPAGHRDTRITIEQPKSDATLDAAGFADRSLDANWEAFDARDGKRWAQRHTKGGREFARTRALYPELDGAFDVLADLRTRAIDSHHRVRWEERTVDGLVTRTAAVIAAYELDRAERRERLVRIVWREHRR